MATTTIKVPVELRDRINHDAREHGTTAAGFIERLLDAYEPRQRVEASFPRRQPTGSGRTTSRCAGRTCTCRSRPSR